MFLWVGILRIFFYQIYKQNKTYILIKNVTKIELKNNIYLKAAKIHFSIIVGPLYLDSPSVLALRGVSVFIFCVCMILSVDFYVMFILPQP